MFENFEDGGRFDVRKLCVLFIWFVLIFVLVLFFGIILIWKGLFINGGFEFGGIKCF